MVELNSVTKLAILLAFPIVAILTDEQAMSAGSVSEFLARIFSDSFLLNSFLTLVLAVGTFALFFIIHEGVTKSLED